MRRMVRPGGAYRRRQVVVNRNIRPRMGSRMYVMITYAVRESPPETKERREKHRVLACMSCFIYRAERLGALSIASSRII